MFTYADVQSIIYGHKEREYTLESLKRGLEVIQRTDPSSKETFDPIFEATEQEYYDYRNFLIHEAIVAAKINGLKAGFLIHQPITDIIDQNWDYRWGVVAYIELPTGQVSWHLESPDIIYDGHNYVDKMNRINEFIKED
jgi:hypothetical protein